ncbi:hypothetical protein BC830DRAFT_953305 [Chytriomyces sp. MP71]|nr:hypothetical protein BC830DRAFT_953305 [Chytriomyces sp. MP71]
MKLPGEPPTPQKRAASLDPEPLTTSLDLVIDPSPVKRARLAPPVDDATPRSNPLKRSAPAVPEPAPVTKRSADAGLESLKGQLALMKERQLAATAAARLASAAARHPASVPPQADPPAPPAALAAALPRATALLDSSDEGTGSDEEDMDMSLVAPDSMDPQRELTRARVLVGNTQWGIEDAVGPEEADMECDDEEEEEVATTPRPALQPSQPAEGWGSGIKWVGEKIVSVAASFLTSPVKPAPFMSAMPSAIPKASCCDGNSRVTACPEEGCCCYGKATTS